MKPPVLVAHPGRSRSRASQGDAPCGLGVGCSRGVLEKIAFVNAKGRHHFFDSGHIGHRLAVFPEIYSCSGHPHQFAEVPKAETSPQFPHRLFVEFPVHGYQYTGSVGACQEKMLTGVIFSDSLWIMEKKQSSSGIRRIGMAPLDLSRIQTSGYCLFLHNSEVYSIQPTGVLRLSQSIEPVSFSLTDGAAEEE